MPITAGRPPTAGQLQRLQSVTYNATQAGNAGSQQAVTTTETDCLGCSVTFTTVTAANYLVIAFFDFDVSASGATVAVGRLSIDGTTVTGSEAHGGGASITRTTPGQLWPGTFLAAGSHTVKLRVIKSVAAGTINCVDQHTRLAVIVTEVV